MLHQHRILLVDDMPANIDILRRLLRKEYDLESAASGVECLAAIPRFRPHLVLLDIMMPGMDGYETCRLIKANPASDPVQVILVSGKGSTAERLRGYEADADDYVVKPFDLPELFARLRALIRRSANKTTNVIEIGEIKIDTALRNVSFKEKPVELTAREYALVEFLALHHGTVVTRTQLYEHLFDENESSLSNLLDVHVSNVRKKLGAEFIVTRRGHGYCIE